MALGGVAQQQAQQFLRGDVAPVIDYNKLARAMERVNLSVAVRYIDAASARKKFTELNSNTWRANVNLALCWNSLRSPTAGYCVYQRLGRLGPATAKTLR
jgi:hypothetical protein